MDLLLGAFAVEIERDEEQEDALPNNRFIEEHYRNPFEILSDSQFISYFRLPKHLVRVLIDMLTPMMEPQQPARPKRLTIEKIILTALRFFGSGSYQGITGSDSFVYVSQATVSRSLREVCIALNRPEIFNECVRFPRNMQELEELRDRFWTKYQFPGVLGCVDCTHVAIIGPSANDNVYPEHVYVNRKNYHSINVQLVCDDNLRILNCNARFPGSVHDARIWRQSSLSQLMERIYRANVNSLFFLLGDSGYPHRPWLPTPIRDPQPGAEWAYNDRLTSIRSLIERCNGVLKMRFRCLLKHRVLHYSPTMASKIINSCVVLHNMCRDYQVPDIQDEPIANELFGIFDVQPEVNVLRLNPDLDIAPAIRNGIIRDYF